jgi:hypothetical protein
LASANELLATVTVPKLASTEAVSAEVVAELTAVIALALPASNAVKAVSATWGSREVVVTLTLMLELLLFPPMPALPFSALPWALFAVGLELELDLLK